MTVVSVVRVTRRTTTYTSNSGDNEWADYARSLLDDVDMTPSDARIGRGPTKEDMDYINYLLSRGTFAGN